MSTRPRFIIAYLIIGLAGLVMLLALLSGPRIRRYARERQRMQHEPAAEASPAASGQRP